MRVNSIEASACAARQRARPRSRGRAGRRPRRESSAKCSATLQAELLGAGLEQPERVHDILGGSAVQPRLELVPELRRVSLLDDLVGLPCDLTQAVPQVVVDIRGDVADAIAERQRPPRRLALQPLGSLARGLEVLMELGRMLGCAEGLSPPTGTASRAGRGSRRARHTRPRRRVAIRHRRSRRAAPSSSAGKPDSSSRLSSPSSDAWRRSTDDTGRISSEILASCR